MRLRHFQTLTDPGETDSASATAFGPPLASMICDASMNETLLAVTINGKHKDRRMFLSVTSPSVISRRMSDAFENLEGTWDRLRWARMRWQEKRGVSPNAVAAAESLNIKPGTYRAYERTPDSSKHIPLDHQTAMLVARKFGVSWQWLLTGVGTPEDISLTPNELKIIDALREAPEDRQAAAADAIIQLLKIN